MKLQFASFAAVAALALASPVFAADWAGVREVGNNVPVPVPPPAPVPTFDADSDWYVGLNLGADLSQNAKVTDYDPCGCTSTFDSEPGAAPVFGLSFGRYFTPSLRGEVSLDYHRDSTIFEVNNPNYAATSRTGDGPSYTDPVTNVVSPTFDTSDYNISRSDRVRIARTVGLVNLLYDINTGTRFTPYVGGGVGFTWRRAKRTYTETGTCTQSYNTSAGLPSGYDYPSGYCVNTTSLPSTFTTTGTVAKDQFDFAAAVQVGLAYAVTESVTWDNGYQALWEGNGMTVAAPTFTGTNTVHYKDAVLQEFRSGLRIRFN